MFDIIWGCLTTIFACTWVSVHPNVPPPDQDWLALRWRRLWMMLMAVIAPEVMVGFAARQLFVAWRLSNEFNLSYTHGFFFSMGGFVSQVGHPIATFKQLEDSVLGSEYLSAIRKVKVADIMDKSKGDALSKGVALMQGLWFITQSIARVHQHLPVTELEVATLAFAIVNVFIWVIWWKKPLDVEQPIWIGPVEEELEPGLNTPHLAWGRRFYAAVTGGYPEDYNSMVSTSVPAFWSMEDSPHDGTRRAFIMECCVGSIFGAIHCAAWNTDFPTANEMWMWRACSLMVTVIPMLVAALFILGVALGNVTIRTTLSDIFVLAVIPIYIIVRLFLIILPFAALRALPPSAFADVNWSVYIPHL
ncbi:hypothetical protein DFH09DRAFT_1079160 [Mycena vulgaris]|nr:hypothetical protein DFH09DRAFT_1079160 [Mycena vulgaris]